MFKRTKKEYKEAISKYIDLKIKRGNDRITALELKIDNEHILIGKLKERLNNSDKDVIDNLILEHKNKVDLLLSQINTVKSNLLKYKNFNIDDDEMAYIITFINRYIMKSIISGSLKTVNLPLGLGTLKMNYLTNVNYKKRKVNMGKSMNYLEQIASEVNPNLLKEYKDKLCSKREFIDGMKEYTYPKTDRKWLFYRLDDDNLYIQYIAGNIYKKHRQLFYYNLRFTKFANIGVYKTADMLKLYTTEEAILNDTRLGNVNKVVLLRRVVPNYKNRFKE